MGARGSRGATKAWRCWKRRLERVLCGRKCLASCKATRERRLVPCVYAGEEGSTRTRDSRQEVERPERISVSSPVEFKMSVCTSPWNAGIALPGSGEPIRSASPIELQLCLAGRNLLTTTVHFLQRRCRLHLCCAFPVKCDQLLPSLNSSLARPTFSTRSEALGPVPVARQAVSSIDARAAPVCSLDTALSGRAVPNRFRERAV